MYNNLTFLALTFPALLLKRKFSASLVSQYLVLRYAGELSRMDCGQRGGGKRVRSSFYCGLIDPGPWLVSRSSPSLSASGWCTLISSGPSPAAVTLVLTGQTASVSPTTSSYLCPYLCTAFCTGYFLQHLIYYN